MTRSVRRKQKLIPELLVFQHEGERRILGFGDAEKTQDVLRVSVVTNAIPMKLVYSPILCRLEHLQFVSWGAKPGLDGCNQAKDNGSLSDERQFHEFDPRN